VDTCITDLKPIQGFCAEVGGAVAFFGATALGIPIYTIRTVTGSIVGMGAARRTSAVRWESGARHRGSLGDHRAVLGHHRHRLLLGSRPLPTLRSRCARCGSNGFRAVQMRSAYPCCPLRTGPSASGQMLPLVLLVPKVSYGPNSLLPRL